MTEQSHDQAHDPARNSGAASSRLTQKGRRLRAYRAYLDLLDAAESMRHDLGGQLESFDLTIEGFRILEMLYRDGPVTVSAICAKRRCRRPSLLAVTDRLQKRGWLRYEVTVLAPVEIRPSKLPKHRRGLPIRGKRIAALHLTAAGEKFIGLVFPRHTKLVAAFMLALDAREQEHLSRLCRKLSAGDAFKMIHEIMMEDVD